MDASVHPCFHRSMSSHRIDRAGDALPRRAARRTRETVLARRAFLWGAGAASAGALGGPRPARAQGRLSSLEPEEPVAATMKRLFGSRPIRDAGRAIALDLPLIAENGAQVPVTVEVQSPMTEQQFVRSIYIVADRNRRPLNAKFALTPAMGQAYVGANLRLGESTAVRAIAELSDGTLLITRREVSMTA